MGSHNDFKYIAPHLEESGIRVIAINYPGFGYSSCKSISIYFNLRILSVLAIDDDSLSNDNMERTDFVQQILAVLNISGKLIFLGHSRGSENALRLSALHKEQAIGAILVNPIGFRRHKSLRPW